MEKIEAERLSVEGVVEAITAGLLRALEARISEQPSPIWRNPVVFAGGLLELERVGLIREGAATGNGD